MPISTLSSGPNELYSLLLAVISFPAMKRLKIAFILLAITVLAIMGSMLYRNFGVMVRQDVIRELINPAAELSMKTPRFVETRGEEKILEVEADKAFYFKGEGAAELENPRAVFYGKGGKKTMVKGDKGMIDTESNDVTVEGNVELISPDGYTLKTSFIDYKKKTGTVATDRRVKLSGDGFEIKGVGMKAGIDNGTIYIYRDVEAFFEAGFKGGPFGKNENN